MSRFRTVGPLLFIPPPHWHQWVPGRRSSVFHLLTLRYLLSWSSGFWSQVILQNDQWLPLLENAWFLKLKRRLANQVRSSKSLDTSGQMKTDIHFLLKRIEWYNSWRRALELLSALFPSVRASTERIGHVSALKWAREGFSSELAQPRPGCGVWMMGWILGKLNIAMAVSMWRRFPMLGWCWAQLRCSWSTGQALHKGPSPNKASHQTVPFPLLFCWRIISCTLLLLSVGFGLTTEMDISPNARLLLNGFPF